MALLGEHDNFNYPVRSHEANDIFRQGLTNLGWTCLRMGKWWNKDQGRTLNMWCLQNTAGRWFSFRYEDLPMELEVMMAAIGGVEYRCYAFEAAEDAAVFKLAHGGDLHPYS